MLILSNILIILSLLLMTCGMIGLIRARGFYRRLLVSALIDTIGVLTLLLGLALRAPTLSFSLKVVFLMITIFLIAPLITHKLGRSPYMSGLKQETEDSHG